MLEQRLFLQRMWLTTHQQLKQHDSRLIDSLSLLTSYSELGDGSEALKLLLSDSDSWVQNVIEPENTWETNYLLFLAELSLALGINKRDHLIPLMLKTDSEKTRRFGLELLLRDSKRLPHEYFEACLTELNPIDLLLLGKCGDARQVSGLRSIVTDIQADQIQRNFAQLGLLLLGERVDSAALFYELLKHPQYLTDEVVNLLVSAMSKDRCDALIKDLASTSNIEKSLLISVMSKSACVQYIPFLCEFLSQEPYRETVLKGLVTQLGDELVQLIPYEAFHPTRDVAWDVIDTNIVEKDILDWFHASAANRASRQLAGQDLSSVKFEEVLLYGNSLQRNQAAVHLTFNNPSHALICSTALSASCGKRNDVGGSI
ncbi:hypothetical protein ACFOEK_12060 [Litoribrevibacter euphylliae]|uniref:HEAT repeat domain-containing protein n=1 Tax=Litoribrevibacter euphylliae TaxID=1834034 RepID=A0ABV7HGB8_9GAMM